MIEAADTTTATTCNPFCIRHMVLRNANYHEARLRVLDRRNRLMTFVTLVLGTAVAGDVGRAFLGGPATNLWLGALVAVVGAAQLVFDFGGTARTHQMLLRDFTRLLAAMMREEHPTQEEISNWTAQMIEIGADAPPMLRALDAVAHTEASATLGADRGDYLFVPIWEDLTKHWLAHPGVVFETVNERKARLATKVVT